MGKVAAFFDMDHTVTWKNAGLTSVQFARKQGMVTVGSLLLGLVKIALYRLSLLNIEQWYERNMSLLAGLPLEDLERFSAAWFETMIRKSIYKDALELIKDHRAKGHHLVVISNSPPFFVRQMANALGVADMITTQVEISNGTITGRLIKPLCYGKGKRHYALRWSAENNIDLSRSYFYTDSFYDIDFLHDVGFPVATNPDRKLRRAAMHNQWMIMDFKRESAF
jgi:HAD superfamily hydrolase (TIGR01490 family)